MDTRTPLLTVLHAFCDDCAFGCTEACERVTPGAQPYWVAFEMATGQRGAVGRGAEYIIWNGRQWRAWAKERGRGDARNVTETERADFGRWLAGRHGSPSAFLAGVVYQMDRATARVVAV